MYMSSFLGFGHLSPATTLGKIICMIYSLLGVPINGIFIGSLGAYFRNKVSKVNKEKQEYNCFFFYSAKCESKND